jgi:hypothetical protein
MKVLVFFLSMLINTTLLTSQVIDLTGFPKMTLKEFLNKIPNLDYYKLYFEQNKYYEKGEFETTYEYNERKKQSNRKLANRKYKISFVLYDNFYNADSSAYIFTIPQYREKLIMENKIKNLVGQRWVNFSFRKQVSYPPEKPVKSDEDYAKYDKDSVKYKQNLNDYLINLDRYNEYQKLKDFRNIKFRYDINKAKEIPFLSVDVIFNILEYSDIDLTISNENNIQYSSDNSIAFLIDKIEIQFYKIFEVNVYAGNIKKLLHSIKY